MKDNNESGFSYIEVMVALVILLVGILALMAAITSSVIQSKTQQQQLNAKQIATSTMEAILSAKETDGGRLGWNTIGNIGSNPNGSGVPQGIFSIGFLPIKTDAGPDQIVGTNDDTGPVVTGYQRRIVISDICDPDRPSSNCPTPGTFPVRMRSVEVTVNYFVGTIERQEQLRTILTDYAITN